MMSRILCVASRAAERVLCSPSITAQRVGRAVIDRVVMWRGAGAGRRTGAGVGASLGLGHAAIERVVMERVVMRGVEEEFIAVYGVTGLPEGLSVFKN